MRALNRDFIREIIKTKGRFLSILVLAALAVAFLSGLRAIAPDMKNTLDDYMDSRNMADLQVYASLGLTEDDIGAMLQQDGIIDGEAFYLIDAFASCGETGKPVKLWSMPQRIGLLVIREGRMPENSGECLIDGKYSKEELKLLNEYCDSIDMELIPCIQTLAHLNAIFRWKDYVDINDIDDILLVDDERT